MQHLETLRVDFIDHRRAGWRTVTSLLKEASNPEAAVAICWKMLKAAQLDRDTATATADDAAVAWAQDRQ